MYKQIMLKSYTLEIWIQMWHKQNKQIFSVSAEIWTRISRSNNGCISQLYQAAAFKFATQIMTWRWDDRFLDLWPDY